MSENSFKSIRNGVIASVIAGIILLSVVPLLRGYVVEFFSWLRSGVLWCWDILISSYSFPGWAWLLIFILALIGLVKIFLAIKSDKGAEYKSYVEDFIYGVKWRWHWVGHQIFNIWCFCPRCDATLVYDDSSCRNPFSPTSKTDFICENCGHSIVGTMPIRLTQKALGGYNASA